jgi:hypothetical protein
MPPAFIHPHNQDAPPPYSLSKASSSRLALKALDPVDLTASDTPYGSRSFIKSNSKSKGKGKAVEIIEISDDEEEEEEEEEEDKEEADFQLAIAQSKASFEQQQRDGYEDDLNQEQRLSPGHPSSPSRSPSPPQRSTSSDARPLFRHTPSPELLQPTSTMAESADGSPAGQIDVLYSLSRSGGSSSAAKKRRRRGEQEEPSSRKKKAKVPLAIDEEEVDELEGDDNALAPGPFNPFSARSNASTQYGLFTHLGPSDIDDSPLDLQERGREECRCSERQ